MENKNIFFQFVSKKFKEFFHYDLLEIRDIERAPRFMEYKIHLLSRGVLGMMLLCIVLSLFPLSHGGYHLVMTYMGLVAVFALSVLWVKYLKRPDYVAVCCVLGVILVFGIAFITEPDPESVGFDAFWLWILIIPFFVDYFAGIVLGSLASTFGLVLSVLYMWTPLRVRFAHYGKDILTYYPAVYFILAVWAGLIQYQLFGYQAEELENEKVRQKQQEEHIRDISKRQEERIRNMEKQLAAYEENRLLVERYHHDLRHYTRVLREYLRDGDTYKAVGYLNEIDGNLDQVVQMTYCENHLINSILSVFQMRFSRLACITKIRALVPEDLKISDLDLTAILSNILEDACDALQKVEEKNRLVNIKINYRDGKLRIQVENTCAVQTRFTEDGLPVSTKEVRGGTGTKSVRDIALEYQGAAGFSQDGDRFITMVVIGC